MRQVTSLIIRYEHYLWMLTTAYILINCKATFQYQVVIVEELKFGSIDNNKTSELRHNKERISFT